METEDLVSASSSLVDNTNVDNLIGRQRSGSTTSNNNSNSNRARKSLSSSSSTASSSSSSSSCSSAKSVESTTSIRSSNRRRNSLAPGNSLSASASEANLKLICKQKSSNSIINEQENTSNSNSSIISSNSSSSSTNLTNGLLISNSKTKKSTSSIIEENNANNTNHNQEKTKRQTRQAINHPAPPMPIEITKNTTKTILNKQVQKSHEIVEPTLTESTNIDKNDTKKNTNKTNNKKQRKLNGTHNKTELVNIIEKNENILDQQEVETINSIDDVARTPGYEELKSIESSNTNEESSTSTTNKSNFVSAQLDDNTLDGFNFNSRNKSSSKPNDQRIVEDTDGDIDVEKLTADENTTTQMDTDDNNNTNKNENTEPSTEQLNTSTNEIIKEKRVKKKRKSIMVKYMDHLTACSSVSKIFVYKWPQKIDDSTDNDNDDKINDDHHLEADSYLLQEQISEYLGVKSFKRKYPDIFRRILDIKEREYLKENNVVTETQCDLGLTALKLNDILDLMAYDYPDKFKEFSSYLSETRLKNMQAAAAANTKRRLDQTSKLHKEQEGHHYIHMTDSEKMKEMIKKAIKSATAYNSQLQKEKKNERASFFDLQTMRIQKPCINLLKIENPSLPESSETLKKPSSSCTSYYPVAVLQGQFQYYYKRYSSEELKHMPINTVIYNPPLPEPLLYQKWKRHQLKNKNKPFNENNDSTDEEEIAKNDHHHHNHQKNHHNQQQIQHIQKERSIQPSKPTINPNLSNIISNTATTSGTFRITASAAPTIAKLISGTSTGAGTSTNILSPTANKMCYICLNKSSNIATINEPMILCSSCKSFSHPNCLELNPTLVNWQCIRQYEWECMECKKCSICSNPHDDDKMMFCDRCDRGFHTYCVNVEKVPSGSWLCNSCKLCNENTSNDEKIIKNFCSNNEDAKLMDSHVLLNNLSKSPLFKQANIKSEQILTLATPPNNLLKSKIKDRFSSNSASIDSIPSSLNVKKGGRGRGRPPGSLNKPKDPNSPRKSANKLNKIKKMELNLNNSMSNQMSGLAGNSNMHTTISGGIYGGFGGDESNMNHSDFNDMDYDDDNSLQNSSYLNFTSSIVNIPKFEFHANANSFHSYN